MRAGPMRMCHRMGIRFSGLCLSLLLMEVLIGQLASARQIEPMSPSVVLVLKLVSATHVKPVTGIVVSDNGLVLVPADFVSETPGAVKGEIVVLDGGTDILSHGRPAKVINSSTPGGMAILSVEGLKRPGIVLSETSFDPDDELHLAAFPPAGQIAMGADPLWVPVNIVKDEVTANIAVSFETPLPYVTGAILDVCGYLAGLSLTSGAQSLEVDRQPVAIFAGELGRVLDSIQVSLPRASCVSALPQAESAASINDKSGVTVETSDQEEPAQTNVIAGPVPGKNVEVPVEELSPEISKADAKAPDSPAVVKPSVRPSLWLSIPTWLIVSSLMVLIVAAWKIIAYIRLHTNEPMPKVAAPHVSRPQPASDEPETAQLGVESETSMPTPRSGQVDEAVMPDIDDLPEGLNAVVVIKGKLDSDTRFKRYCVVNAERFDIVIGRGETDISIEHPAISRNHARLECERGQMTLSDLNSSNGTQIGGIPCLPQEVMFVSSADEIYLGDVGFQISLVKKEAGLS